MQQLPRPHAIFFDMGGTLLRPDRWDPAAGTRAVLALATNPDDVTAQQVDAAVRELDADLRPRRASSMIELPPWTVRRLVYERLRLEFAESCEEVEIAFLCAARSWKEEPGIRDVLKRLSALRIPLGVITNTAFSGNGVAWELRQHRLDHFFEFIMASADYVVRKPHRSLFLTAVGKLGVRSEDAWHVGDSPEYDVAGALAAGMIAVLYNPTGVDTGNPTPHAVACDWEEFRRTVEYTMHGAT